MEPKSRIAEQFALANKSRPYQRYLHTLGDTRVRLGQTWELICVSSGQIATVSNGASNSRTQMTINT